jgi:hypothetical protein
VVAEPSLAGPLVTLGVLAVAAAASGVASGRFAGVAAGVVLSATAYLWGQWGRPLQVLGTAAFGAALLLAAELAWWSMELSSRAAWPGPLVRRRWASLAMAAGGGFATAVLAGLVAISAEKMGAAVVAAGAAAAVVLAVGTFVALRSSTRPWPGDGAKAAVTPTDDLRP